jgi:hypothetical protein
MDKWDMGDNGANKTTLNAKVSWEDLTTGAGREMWRLQNPEVSSKLTLVQSEEFL